jgi:hypothetical protein
MRARITWGIFLIVVGLAWGIRPTNRFLSDTPSAAPDVPPALAAGNHTLPRSFEENQGQTDPGVRFLSRGNGYTLFLTASEAIMSLRRPQDVSGKPDGQPLMLRMRPIGANPAPRVAGDSPLPATVNYVRGRTPDQWLTGIATYSHVRYEEVYAGVDLVYYDNGKQLEYDFVVAPGADPGRIRVQFSGVETLRVDAAGDLVLGTPLGELRQPAPLMYQETDGAREVISGGYIVGDANQISFHIGAYDGKRPLVIDPVLAYSTYFGGSAEETGSDIAVDAAGNAYVAGAWKSVRSPEAYDSDGYVAKFSSAGALLWVASIGDTCDDEARGLALDASGNVYVTGQLGYCYPWPTLNGGAFVAKLSAQGAARYMFPFSDYWYGGPDMGQAVTVDAAGIAYVAGITSSAEFPVTPGAFQPTYAGGIADGFAVKVNAAGTALLYGTYLGGTAFESLNDLAIDGQGYAYVVGKTESPDFPTMNAFQPVHPGSIYTTSFVTKLAPDGTTAAYSTFLGVGPTDIAMSVAVDAAGHAYVAGVTTSSEFPVTPGVVQPQPGDTRICFFTLCTDAFVTKFSPSGQALVYSTYLGGDIFDEATGIAIDTAGNAYITGNTDSFTFPTVAAFQPESAGGVDAFVTKLNSTGSALIYSSYLGGSALSDANFEGEDAGVRIAVQPTSGAAYVIGMTRSSDFPVVNAHQPTFGGGVCGILNYRCADAFIAKIGTSCSFTISPTSQSITATGGARTVAVTASANTCQRTATSGVPWITITSGATGTGSGQVGYSVAAHTGTAARTGTVNVAGQVLTVTQSAATVLDVRLLTPNGGEKLYGGTPYVITWTATGATSFDVAASIDGGTAYTPLAGCSGLAAGARSCTWVTPGPVSANARIRVTGRNAGGALSDVSDAAFSILSGVASLNVTFPNTAVNVGIGSTQVIKWNHNLGTTSFVKIELSRDGGVTFPETLAAAYRNTSATSGTFNWLVTGPAMAVAQARVRVSWTGGPTSDVNDTSFIIAPVFINVTAPATTGRWGFNTTQRQSWTTNLGALDRVHVQLSTAGIGGAFTTMTGGSSIVANTRKADVLVPATATATARVRVIWANPPAGFSATGNNPGDFAIGAPSIALTAPAAGAVWAIGTTKTIAWTSNLGALEKVEIRLSKDGGASYPIVVAASTPSDGKHSVTIDAAWGSQTTTRFKITWLKATGTTGTTSNFTIQP